MLWCLANCLDFEKVVARSVSCSTEKLWSQDLKKHHGHHAVGSFCSWGSVSVSCAALDSEYDPHVIGPHYVCRHKRFKSCKALGYHRLFWRKPCWQEDSDFYTRVSLGWQEARKEFTRLHPHNNQLTQDNNNQGQKKEKQKRKLPRVQLTDIMASQRQLVLEKTKLLKKVGQDARDAKRKIIGETMTKMSETFLKTRSSEKKNSLVQHNDKQELKICSWVCDWVGDRPKDRGQDQIFKIVERKTFHFTKRGMPKERMCASKTKSNVYRSHECPSTKREIKTKSCLPRSIWDRDLQDGNTLCCTEAWTGFDMGY